MGTSLAHCACERETKHSTKSSTGIETEEGRDLGSSSPGSSSHRTACCTRHRGMPRQMWQAQTNDYLKGKWYI